MAISSGAVNSYFQKMFTVLKKALVAPLCPLFSPFLRHA